MDVKLSEAADRLNKDIKTLHKMLKEKGIIPHAGEDRRASYISEAEFDMLKEKPGKAEIPSQLPPTIPINDGIMGGNTGIGGKTEKQPLLPPGHMAARALMSSDANIFTRVQLLEELVDWQDQQIRKLIRHVKVIEEVLRSQAHYDLELSDPELQAVKAINEETDKWAASLDKKEGKE
jgi:hypothetical protein